MLRECYGNDNILVAAYANPLSHRSDEFDVQFVLPNRRVCQPLVSSAGETVIADPLSGPFYQLGIEAVYLKKFSDSAGDWVPVRTLVRLPSGKPAVSAAILIKDNIDNLASFLKDNGLSLLYEMEAPIILETASELVQEDISIEKDGRLRLR